MHLLKNRTDFIFFSTGFLITIFYILIFKPVSDVGDGPAYLKYAQTIVERGDTSAFISRAPLYPWLLSLFISAFGMVVAVKIIFALQYFLLFISILVLYDILIVLFDRKSLALSAALIAMLNFSGIFYGFMLLTETMTLFFLILTIWFLYRGINKFSLISIFFSGISFSTLVLTRFNTLPLLLIFLGLIFLFEFKAKKFDLRNAFRSLLIFLIPVILILNVYAFLNYQKHEFYGLFPSGGSILVSRNALIATIDGSEEVSEKYKPVLDIFREADETVIRKYPVERKGSLARFDRYQMTGKLYEGFQVYSTALPELCSFFRINPAKPEPDLSNRLSPFYREISKLNKNEVSAMRVLSLISSFRSSTGLVIPGKPGINLGKLPAWMIIGYKLIVFTLSFMVFAYSVIYLTRCILKVTKPNWPVILFIVVIFGFYFINFSFATVNDANRFKYPAEPLIISLSVYYIYIAYNYIKRKIICY